MSRKKNKRSKRDSKPADKKKQETKWDSLGYFKKRRALGEGKELLAELRAIKKRFGFRDEKALKKLSYKLTKDIPGLGHRGVPLLSQEGTDKIELHLDSWREVRHKKEDPRPLIKKMDQLVTEELAPYRPSKFWGYARSFLIAASVALFLRAFAFEPFRIPSGSMIPTLQVGDYIYVNKFVYGLRVPFTQNPPRHFVNWSLPERGDIVVFIEPLKNSEDWIKRVVALPGDHVKFNYETNQLLLKRGGKGDWTPVVRKKLEKPCSYMDKNEKLNEDWHRGKPCDLFEEKLDGHTYQVIYDKVRRGPPLGFPTSWEVPKGCVFVMGDNRDNSEDSRFLVKDGKPHPCIPINNIKGRAEFIWLSRGPEGMRWSRLFSGVH